MAFEIIRKTEGMGTKDNRRPEIVAILDAETDFTALGTNYSAGSIAKVAGGNTFILSASHVWVEEE